MINLITLLNELTSYEFEKEWFEFKLNMKSSHEIGEYISALSNSATLHKQNYAYMIWGVENNTRKILGTDFKYDLDINGSEVFKHYLARNLEPHISFKFEEIYIGNDRLVCLTIPAAKDVITEFNHERFIRIGSSKEKLKKFPKYEAELLADENDIVINVATFATNDKTEYLKRNEFGGKCLLLAMEQAKNYIEAINQIYVDTKVRPRKEKPMFNMDAFKEAWYNACVHYKWSEANNPGIYVYADRLEIESFGGIPSDLSKRQFLLGVSKPVNKRLFEIFKTCGFVEESGHGVPTVTKAYGDDSYIFDGKFIKVVIPFDRSGFNNTIQETLDTTKKTTKKDENTTKKTTKEKIIELLRNNPNLSRSDLSVILKLSEDGIQYHLNDLKKKGIIERVGPDKGGHWEVKE